MAGVDQSGEIWVFGYGSLMWRPGFPYLEAAPALLRGYHRAFCIYSIHHRGSRRRPGLILGLDRGGSCRGRAFKVAADDADAAITYLDSRELITHVYLRRNIPVAINGARIDAVCYVADPGHAQYAGALPLAEAARVIRGGHGISGDNPEYLRNVTAHLDELGIADGPIHRLMAQVEGADAP
jgi:cation transport protein ChaC